MKRPVKSDYTKGVSQMDFAEAIQKYQADLEKYCDWLSVQASSSGTGIYLNVCTADEIIQETIEARLTPTSTSKLPTYCNNIYNCAYLSIKDFTSDNYPIYVCTQGNQERQVFGKESRLRINPHEFCKGEFKTATIAPCTNPDS